MKHYKDADEILRRLPDDLPYKASVKRVLMQAPTADVVEVVRCKDCKWCQAENWDGEMLFGCDCAAGLNDVDPYGFCSYGEKREP